MASGRLKLREWGAESDPAATNAQLIAYHRPDSAGSRESEYRLVPVADGPALAAALAETAGVRVVVAKTRRLFLFGHTRIHLDTVDELGLFLELETVFSDPLDPSAYQAEHNLVIATLGLAHLAVVSGSYSDLFLEQGGRSGPDSGLGPRPGLPAPASCPPRP